MPGRPADASILTVGAVCDRPLSRSSRYWAVIDRPYSKTKTKLLAKFGWGARKEAGLGSEAAVDYGAIPSVISILVPHGSAMKATRILLTKLLGVSP